MKTGNSYVYNLATAANLLGCNTDVLKMICADEKINYTFKFEYKFFHKDLVGFLNSNTTIDIYLHRFYTDFKNPDFVAYDKLGFPVYCEHG